MLQAPFKQVLVLCVPADILRCPGSMLPVLPTFLNSGRITTTRLLSSYQQLSQHGGEKQMLFGN